MEIIFNVYHSEEFESFTLIEQSKLKKQSALLEKDAKIIHTFSIFQTDEDDEESVFKKAKKIYNQVISDFYSK